MFLPVAVATLVILLVLGQAPRVSGESSTPQAQPPDVLLITLDTLRADALGFMGNERVETPVLDRLAASGRVFERAHAHNVVTLPSHANILTGLYPYQHGVRDNSGFRLRPELNTLAEELSARGYATGAFIAAYPLDSQFGLDQGFEVYDDQLPSGAGGTSFTMAERPGTAVVAKALDWWQSQSAQPRFLWVHLFDPHAPYDPPEPFASRFRDAPYLGEVSATDHALEPLLQPLLSGRARPALVIVTADHGEALGEHGEITHGLFAYEPTLHVPLVLWGAGVQSGRDRRWARHVDIFPTVLHAVTGKSEKRVEAAAGLPSGEVRSGSSLLRATEEGGVSSYFEALSASLNRGWAPLRGTIVDGNKAISLPLPELYDLTVDPGEERNLENEQRRTLRGLLGSLPQESEWPPARGEVSTQDVERLRSLGYIASSAPSKKRYGPEDDPKRLIELDRSMHRIIDLYSRGDLQTALPLARQLVESRPDMALGQSLLAQTLLQMGKREEAIAVMRKAQAAGAVTDAMLRQLGLSLAEAGKAGEAIEVLEPLTRSGEPSSMLAYALALSQAGQHEPAVQVLRQVLREDPDNPLALERLGLVALRQQQWKAAADHSQAALDLNPLLAQAWNNLGVARFQLQQAEAALDAWQRAVDLDPELFDALYNLGTKALALGRDQQALTALQAFVERAPAAGYEQDLRRARVLVGRLQRRLGQQ